jgi:hypothetical protein
MISTPIQNNMKFCKNPEFVEYKLEFNYIIQKHYRGYAA